VRYRGEEKEEKKEKKEMVSQEAQGCFASKYNCGI